MSQAAPGDEATPRTPANAAHGLVLRNTIFLVAAQVVATPLSLLINLVAARTLGPGDFGQMYLAMTFGSFAFLFVEWGQSGTLTAMVAKDRARAGELLGSGLAWRAGALPAVVAALFAVCWLLGYPRSFLDTLALVLLAMVFATVSSACQDVFRGHERTDVGATSYVAWQMLTALIVLPVLLLGGRLHAFLLAQAFCAGIGALVLLRCLAPMGVPAVRVHGQTIKVLFSAGTSFLFFNLILALQTNVDAVFLSKLASAQAIGWNAAANKLTGFLIFPATALIGALYPTLCRLHGHDFAVFGHTARSALRMTLIAAVPTALGCALFPQIGIAFFGIDAYAPAEDNLRVLAVYVLLVYFTMPLGTTLVAAGRQRAWAAAQFACVLISVAFDPLLIPWFQQTTGNGGLGVCVSAVGSEVLMVAAGIWLLPRGVLDRSLWRTLFVALGAGVAMTAVAMAFARLTPYAAAPLALLAYAVGIWAAGEVDRRQLAVLRVLWKRPAPLAAGSQR